MPVTFGSASSNLFTNPATDIVQNESEPTNLFQSILGGAGDVLGLIARPANAVAGFGQGLLVKNDIGKAFQFAKEGFLGDAQFHWSDTLRKLGMPKLGSGIQLPFIGELTGRGTLGFALDVATDPLTYIGLTGLTGSAKYLAKGLSVEERTVLGGLKQQFSELYGGLLHGALSSDAEKVDSFFKGAKDFVANPNNTEFLKAGEVSPFEQAALPGQKIDFSAMGTTVNPKTGKLIDLTPKDALAENTPLKVLLKSERGQKIRQAFDEQVLPQLQESFKAKQLAGIDPTQVNLYNNAADILDHVTDLNMSNLQMFRNVAAEDMGFLGHTLTDQAAKGYRSLITFAGKSPADLAQMVGMPEVTVKQLRGIDAMVFKGIDNVLGKFTEKFPKFTDQLYRMFHSGTGIPEVDETISKYQGQGNADMRNAFIQGVKVLRNQSDYVKNLDPSKTRQFFRDVIDQMEFANPNNTLMTNVVPPRQFMPGSHEFAQALRVVSDQTYRLKAKTLDLLKLPDMSYLKGYFPRDLTPEMKLLFKNILEDSPGARNGILSQVAKSREGDFAKLTTSQINDYFSKDYAGFEHLRQALSDPNGKWASEIKKIREQDPEMMSFFVDDPGQAIINANINATRAASKAELTNSILKQFGKVVWTKDDPRKFGEFMLAPNVYRVTDMSKLTPKAIRNIAREALGLPKTANGEEIDLMTQALKNFNAKDRIDAAINPDKFTASKGGDLTASLLAKLPAQNVHAFGLLHDLKAPIYVMDEQIHRLIEDMWTKVNDPATYNTIINGLDKVTNLWKTSVTVPFPSFHFRNMLQDAWQMFLGGFNHITELGPNGALGHAFQIMKESGITGKIADLPEEAGNIAKLSTKVISDAGETMTQAQMWNNFVKDGGLVGILRDISTGGEASVDTINEALQKKFLGGLSLNPLNKNFVPVAAGGKTNEIISAYNRLANYISLWKKGMNGAEAMMNTRKVLFDYSDLSNFERNYMKRIFPFYAWSRKNIPFQLQMMVQQPGKFANLMKAVNALEDPTVKDQIPPGGIPNYIRQEFGITTKQNDDGTYRFLLMGGFIPPADLIKVGSLEDAGRLAMKSLNPIFQTPLESLTNKNFFSGLPVRDFPGEKGIFLGQPMSKDTINLLRKIRPINSADKLFFKEDPNNPYQKKELSIPEKITSSLVGINPRDIDVQKIADNRKRDIANIAAKLNSNYKRALSTGDSKMQEYLQNLIEESQAGAYR